MKAQDPGGGRVINNGSISAHVTRVSSAAYSASKHAVTGLTKSASLEGRDFNIACGQIDIGNARTALTQQLSGAGMAQETSATAREATMDVANVAEALLYMANLPLEANVLSMTVRATKMPFVGRG